MKTDDGDALGPAGGWRTEDGGAARRRRTWAPCRGGRSGVNLAMVSGGSGKPGFGADRLRVALVVSQPVGNARLHAGEEEWRPAARWERKPDEDGGVAEWILDLLLSAPWPSPPSDNVSQLHSTSTVCFGRHGLHQFEGVVSCGRAGPRRVASLSCAAPGQTDTRQRRRATPGVEELQTD